jgi:SAM-dependent methyltransferase
VIAAPCPSLSLASVSSPDSLDFYDAELRAHHEHLRAAYGIRPGDEVVDIGCGTGLTTREAACATAPGRAVGVDVSERMLERARQLTAAERLDNVRYELGDAQVHRFDRAGFDVGIGRFGTMFFSDPAAAFANVAAALRHDLDAALAFVRGFQNTSAALARLSAGEATHALERLRETLAAHYSDERGVVLDSRSWLITARRRR